MLAQKTTTGGDRNQKFIARDATGSALQFTGSGRSVQCADMDADVFTSEDDAHAALVAGEETQGVVEAHAEQPKHTPGPWHYGDDSIYDGNGGYPVPVCRIIRRSHVFDAETRANASLIAAAPELFEALEFFVKWSENTAMFDKVDSCYIKAKSAIAKAKGGV